MLDDILAEAAAKFEEHLHALALESAAIQRTELASVRGSEQTELWEINHRITRESRRVQAQHLAHGRRLPETCPEPDIEAARFALHSGIPLADTFKAYRIGHEVTSRVWREVVDELDLSEADRAECSRVVSDFVDSYDRRIADLVGEEYERERLRATPSLESNRFRLVRDLLEGRRNTLTGVDYRLDDHHVGAIAWGSEPQRALRELARYTGAHLLDIRVATDLREGWLGLRSAWTEELRHAIARFPTPAQTAIALGIPAQGLDGFRRTHREAGAARTVALRTRRSVTLHENVALEALALENERRAEEFVERELIGMAGRDPNSEKLRTTLAAYFRAEQNSASTAASLKVHPATVPRHLAQIEERIGRPVNQRRAELELALRLHGLLQHGATDGN